MWSLVALSIFAVVPDELGVPTNTVDVIELNTYLAAEARCIRDDNGNVKHNKDGSAKMKAVVKVTFKQFILWDFDEERNMYVVQAWQLYQDRPRRDKDGNALGIIPHPENTEILELPSKVVNSLDEWRIPRRNLQEGGWIMPWSGGSGSTSGGQNATIEAYIKAKSFIETSGFADEEQANRKILPDARRKEVLTASKFQQMLKEMAAKKKGRKQASDPGLFPLPNWQPPMQPMPVEPMPIDFP